MLKIEENNERTFDVCTALTGPNDQKSADRAGRTMKIFFCFFDFRLIAETHAGRVTFEKNNEPKRKPFGLGGRQPPYRPSPNGGIVIQPIQ
jgi:hypothetical protein